MRPALFLLAVAGLHLDVTDTQGKHASGVVVEASAPGQDGWSDLRVAKSKKAVEIIWPFDKRGKAADGPEPVPVMVIDPANAAGGDEKAVAYLAAGELLGVKRGVNFDAAKLGGSQDSFIKGVGFLYAKKPADAVEPLSIALRERERQLTRVPSEIYAAAMLYGQALFGAGKYDDAAVAYLKALGQRPFDPPAHQARAEALIKAGKPEAAGN